jgi:hypothetical protein
MSWFPDTQRDTTTICVTYLSFDAFGTGFCQMDKEFEARLQLNPLYDCKLKIENGNDRKKRNWGHHARAASIEVELLVVGFLESEAKVSGSSQTIMASSDSHYRGYSQYVPRQITGVHLAAYFRLNEVMVTLLKNGYDPNFKNTYGQTPLSRAARYGHEAVLKLLLAKRR